MWCLNILRAVKGLMWCFTSGYFNRRMEMVNIGGLICGS